MRISEAIKLEVKDVDIPSKILTILDSKFYKNRFVPIGSRLTETLQVYLEKNHIKVIRVNENSTPFLLNRHKKRVTRTCAELTFRRLCLHAKVSRNDNSRYQPRLHDIRHTFCVHRLVDWYRQGADVQRLLPYLSTYLGHINIEGTQRYLTMTPDLLQAANARFEQYAFRGQI